MDRPVLISPYTQGSWDALGEVVNLDLFVEHLPAASPDPVIAGALYQSGATRLDLLVPPGPSGSKHPLSAPAVFRDRFYEIQAQPAYVNIRSTFKRAMERYLPDDWPSDEDYSALSRAVAILNDLLYVAETGDHAIVSLLGLPDLDELPATVPPEITVPLRLLFRTLVRIEHNLPTPRIEVSKQHLLRYREILETRQFEEYARSHSKLETALVPLSDAGDAIVHSGAALSRTHERTFKLRKAAAAVLESAPKLIDTLGGKLPATLADMVTKPLATALRREQRMVIYDLSSVFKAIVLQRIDAYADAKVQHSSGDKG